MSVTRTLTGLADRHGLADAAPLPTPGRKPRTLTLPKRPGEAHKAWKDASGLEVYLVFSPADGADLPGCLDNVPLARIITRRTPKRMHVSVHWREGKTWGFREASTRPALNPITFLLDGLQIGSCTIVWGRDNPSWSDQLRKAGLTVITAF